MFKQTIQIIVALLFAGAASFLLAVSPLLGLLVCLALLLVFLLFLNLELGLILVIASLVLGQVARIPLPGTTASFLPNDLLIPIMLLAWVSRKLLAQKFQIKSTPLNFPLFAFLGIAFVSLVWAARDLVFAEILTASLYLVRFLEYALLFYLILDLVRDKKQIQKYVKFILICALLLAFLGFLQYIFIPDFSGMAGKAGWDPHVKRLLSTWFDPNFIGGFFVLILSFILSFSLYTKRKRVRILLFALGLIFFAALILTYSRSAFLALVAVIFVIGTLRSKKLLLIGCLALLLLVVFSGRLQARLVGAVELDITARHRINSWLSTLKIARDNLFLGVGFNAFKYAQIEYGTIGLLGSHSDFGSDSTLLTVLVTTGIFGLLAYLWLLGAGFKVCWRAFRRGKSNFEQALGLGMFSGLAGLLIHSQFTNSLLYPHFMELFWLFLALIIATRKTQMSLRASPELVEGRPKQSHRLSS